MIYQFEHDEIKRCRECPCHTYENIIERCNLGDFDVAYDSIGIDYDCPLSTISKTETVKCKCCGHICDIAWHYCPNCMQKVGE